MPHGSLEEEGVALISRLEYLGDRAKKSHSVVELVGLLLTLMATWPKVRSFRRKVEQAANRRLVNG